MFLGSTSPFSETVISTNALADEILAFFASSGNSGLGQYRQEGREGCSATAWGFSDRAVWFVSGIFVSACSTVAATAIAQVIAHTTATHPIQPPEMRGRGPISMILRSRSRRKPPGIAIPTMFKRAPERLTDRASSTRHAAYSRALFPRASTALSQASSARPDSVRSNHPAAGWNQKTARFSNANHCNSESRRCACSSSCA